MKTKILFSAFVIAVLFIQQAVAQEVSSMMKSKEKREMLYYSIINNDERFMEFMEAVKSAGRSDEGVKLLQEENTISISPTTSQLEENHTAISKKLTQMLTLIQEFAKNNPEFRKMIAEKYPEINTLLKENQNKL